ncbi:MAG: hypothetical protein KBT19_01540 [Lachnospiraceae bacterium]|nr:hypothetical protein [Candidatus Colinaster equi]
MRKLKRSVERNQRRKKVAGAAMMTVLATSLAVSDSAIAVYAAEPSGYTSECNTESETDSETEESEEETTEEQTETEETAEETTEETAEEETTEEAAKDKSVEKEIKKTAVRNNISERKISPVAATAPGTGTYSYAAHPGDTINLGTLNISDNGKIEVAISENGSYTFKGNNERNGAYVDVSITVDAGVEANIHLDGLEICNDDYVCSATTNYFYPSLYGTYVKPFIINGTANIYVDSDSEIDAVSDLFMVNGTLNFVESAGELSLAPSTRMVSSEDSDFYLSAPIICSGSGELHLTAASFNVSRTTVDAEQFQFDRPFAIYNTNENNPIKVFVESENVHFSGDVSIDAIYTDFSDIGWLGITPSEIFTLDGERVYFVSLSGPANCQIVQISTILDEDVDTYLNISKPSDIWTDADGRLSNLAVRGQDVCIFINNNGTIELYCWSLGASEAYRYYNGVVTITFKDADNQTTIYSYYAKKPDGEFDQSYLYIPKEDSKYTYTYTLQDGTEVTKDTVIEGDMTVYVSKEEKGKISVNVDGTVKQLEIGSKLSAFGGINGEYQDTETGEIVTGEKVLDKDCDYSFAKIGLSKGNHNGKESYILNNDADVTEFANIVNRGASAINGYLTNDVSLSSDSIIASTATNSYRGTFDGCGKKVTLNIDSANSVESAGLFGFVTNGAIIKNVIVDGIVKGTKYAGGIVGAVYNDGGIIDISYCMNYANVNVDNNEAGSAGGIVGKQLDSYITIDILPSSSVTVNYCANLGEISVPDVWGSKVGGIIGSSCGLNTFKNCYNVKNLKLCGYDGSNSSDFKGCYSLMGSNGVTEKSEQAFLSGEVAYLMNEQADKEVWFQSCGEDYPKFTGSHVYAGYEDCSATKLSYKNTPFEHTQPGHKDAGTYVYRDGNVVAGCMYCDEEIKAKINIPSEHLGSSRRGVTVSYSNEWEKAKYPNITFKYSDTIDGDYVATLPNRVGTWYVKAYVGEATEGIAIDETYTVTPKPVVDNKKDNEKKIVTSDESDEDVSNENVPSGESDKPDVTSGQTNETQNVQEMIRRIKEFGKLQKTGNGEGQLVIEYSGASISNAMIMALAGSKNTVIHYTTTYKGQKYDFIITSEIAALADKRVKWCGPRYIQHLFNLRDLNRLFSRSIRRR